MVRLGARTVALVLCTASCAKYTTYGYDYRMSQQLGVSEDPQSPNVEARKLLAMAKTVAFFPPDVCLNTEIVNLNANSVEERKRLQELRASCGVLMSSLERAAESAGYEVLSWQNLRGTKRPIEYAREGNVDILFEINQFTPERMSSSQVEHTLAFFEQTPSGPTPLNVTSSLANACKGQADQSIKLQTVGYLGTIDIKTVQVSDGRDRWHYRKTEQVPVERKDPHVTFTGRNKSNKIGQVAMSVGAVALGLGGGLLLAEKLSTDDPLTPQVDGFDSGGASIGLLVGGGIAIAAAIGLEVGLGGEKPDPNEVLCNSQYQTLEMAHPAAYDPVASQHTFSENVQTEQSEQLKEKIQNDMIIQFVGVLKEAHTGQPPPEGTPAAPAPQPATTP